MRSSSLAAALCVFCGLGFLAVLASARPLITTPSDATQTDAALKQLVPSSRQAVPVPRPLTERIYYDPNRGELNKVEDYIANIYIGEVDFAEADPVAAGAGAAVATGIQFQYDKTSYFDYEAPKSEANIGPGAKAITAAAARLLGAASAKAAARASGKANVAYARNAYSNNAVSIGTVTELTGGMSAGAYLDRSENNVNTALETPVKVGPGFFGH